MARTRRTRAQRAREEEEDEEQEPSVSPETRRGIAIVVLFALAFLFLLSFFDLAGQVGSSLHALLRAVFGWERFIVPALLIIIGSLLLRPERFPLRSSNYFGLFLLVVSVAGFLHLFVVEDAISVVTEEGRGGGYIGYGIALPLTRIMGFWASLVVVVALLLISVLVLFNTTLHELARRGGMFGTVGRAVSALAFWRRRSFSSSAVREEELEDTMEEDDEEQKEEETTEEVDTDAIPEPTEANRQKKDQLPLFKKKTKKPRPTHLSLDLLNNERVAPTSGDIRARQESIRRTLENFGIDVEMDDVNIGPTVTQFTLKPSEGVKLSQITTLSNDLALSLAAHPIRIEAPIPGKSLVGIEVPNESVALVNLREVLESKPFRSNASNLTVALGKDVSGQSITADLGTMPHLLIAGATGSGKSVAINSLIVSLLYQNTPAKLRFIMVDPKRVELTTYDGIPHLLTPVITDSKKTVNALKWVLGEMDRRYETLSKAGKRDIRTYHRDVDDGMPFLVVIVDELADLMSVAAREVEGAVTRLAQMARAVGIHLVVATQRPSVDVITGLIKANITSRIAFSVASGADSRTILDSSGAEKLLGRGDMLYISSELGKPKRVQGAFVGDEDIHRIVSELKRQSTPEYDTSVTEHSSGGVADDGTDADEDETLIEEAKREIVQAGKASASLLQRRLKIGYARAARMLDILEERGLIGPGEGAKPREIFITEEVHDVDDLVGDAHTASVADETREQEEDAMAAKDEPVELDEDEEDIEEEIEEFSDEDEETTEDEEPPRGL